MKIQKLAENVRPTLGAAVTLTEAGNILSVRHMNKQPEQQIQKLDKDSYIVLATGEVLDFQHTDNRADDLQSVRRSMKNLRDIINANVTKPKRCRWITLTYKENMTDSKRLYDDYRKFNQRLKRYCKRNGLPDYEYITVAEPQGRGAWHMHLILIFEDKAPYIPNDTLFRIWGHGYTTIKSLNGVNHIGGYVTAYLCDLELEKVSLGSVKASNVKLVGTGRKKKAIVKGERLKLYPPHFRLFRHSRGIIQPTITETDERAAMQKIGGATLIYERTIRLDYDSGGTNTINYRTYNKKAKRKGGYNGKEK